MFRFDSKNKSLSRILVLALACLLVVTSMPAGTFRAFADETEIPAESGIVPEVPEQEIAQDDEATPGSTQGGAPAVEDPVEMQSEEMDGMINTALRIVNADQADAGGNADGTGEEGESADAKEGELAAAAVKVNAAEQAAATNEVKEVEEAEEAAKAADTEEDEADESDQEQVAARAATVDLTVQKVWGDSGDYRIPSSLTVHLLETIASSDVHKIVGTYTLNAESKWTWTVAGLPEQTEAGETIEYSWSEDFPAGWFLTDVKTDGNTTILTNSPTEVYDPRAAYTGEKTWDCEETKLPNDLKITLKWSYTDDEGTHSGTVLKKNEGNPVLSGEGLDDYEPIWEKAGKDWTYTFSNLPVFSRTGAHIVYTAEETVPDGFVQVEDATVVTETSYELGEGSFKRITNCNVYSFDVQDEKDLTFYYVFKGNGHKNVIWTPRPALESERKALCTLLGISESSVEFVSGVPCSVTRTGSGFSGKPTNFGIIGGKAHIEFGHKKDWAWFEYGQLPVSKYEPGSTDFTNKYEEDTPPTPPEPPTPPVQETIDIPVTKVWNGDEHHTEDRPNTITIELKAGGEVVKTVILGKNGGEEPGVARKAGDVVLKALRRGANDEAGNDTWTYTFEDMPKKDENGNEIEYTIKELDLEDYVSVVTGNAEQGFTITNKFKYTDVYVLKVWDDNDDETGVRPESIDVKLLADGEELYTATVITENDQPTVRAPRREIEVKAQAERILADVDGNEWYFMFAGVPRFDEAGNEIAYSVEEIVPEHYIATITQDTMTIEGKTYHYWKIENECTLTNVYVMKVWNDWDAPEDARPETITVTLLADDEEVQTVEVAPRTPEEVGPALRAPRRAAEAKAAAKTIEAFVVDDTWRFAFEAVPKYDEEGNAITYTVRETVPANYSATYSAQTETFGNQTITYIEIVNTYVEPGMIPIKITKVWDDFDDEDEFRPDTVTIFLEANGDPYRMIELAEDGILLPVEKKIARGEAVREVIADPWTCTVIVPEFDEDGNKITYTVWEVPVGNYDDPVVTGSAEEGFTVTNRHMPTTDVYAMKVWDDNDDSRGRRPETITVTVVANNKDVRTVEVVPIERIPIPVDDQPVLRAVKPNEEDEEQGRQVYAMVVDGTWRFGFYDMPKYDEEGNEITYTLRETVPANYKVTYTEKEINLYEDDTITYWEILNKYTERTPSNPERPPVQPEDPPEDPTEIEDPDTPLAPAEEEPAEIEDPDTPLAPVEAEEEIVEEETPLSPFTGDTRHTAVWGAVSVLSLLGIVLVARKRREE